MVEVVLLFILATSLSNAIAVTDLINTGATFARLVHFALVDLNLAVSAFVAVVARARVAVDGVCTCAVHAGHSEAFVDVNLAVHTLRNKIPGNY